MNTKETQTNTFNTHVSFAGVGRRSAAIFLDFIFVFIFMMIMSLVTNPIVNNIYQDNELQDSLRLEMKRSYLFETDAPLLEDESNIDEINLVEAAVVKQANYASATYKYYTIFLAKEDAEYDEAWYLTNVLKINEEDSLFVVTEDIIPPLSNDPDSEVVIDLFLPPGVKHKESTTLEDVQTFNLAIINDAFRNFSMRPVPHAANMRRVSLELGHTSLLIVVASSIFMLAIPLFTKNGKTLGKLIMKISVTTKYGYRISSFGLLMRYFAFLFIEIALNIALSVLLLGVTFSPVVPLISLTVMVFSKHRKSVHDFVAGTIVVDDQNSIIYNDVYEYEQALIIEKQTTARRDSNVNEEMFAERFKEGSNA